MKNRKIPGELIKFARDLDVGQIIPINTGAKPTGETGDFITFLIRESNYAYDEVKKDPFVEMIPGLIWLGFRGVRIPIINLIIRFNKNPNFTYETGFVFTEDSIKNDYLFLSNQKEFQFVVCTANDAEIIRCDMPTLGATLRALGKIVEPESANLTHKMSLSAAKIIKNSYATPSSLFELFSRRGIVVNLKMRDEERDSEKC